MLQALLSPQLSLSLFHHSMHKLKWSHYYRLLQYQDLSSKCRQAGPHMSRHSQKQIQSRTLNGAGPHLDNGTHVRTRGRRSFRPRSREDMEGDTGDRTPHSERMDPEICNGSMILMILMYLINSYNECHY